MTNTKKFQLTVTDNSQDGKLTCDSRWKCFCCVFEMFFQRWDRLEVQHKRHVHVLGGQLAELEGEASVIEPFR